MPDHFEYDVFLSFAATDEQTVRPLWETLCASGLRVFWSDAALKKRLGESWFEIIQDSIPRSRHFLLVCTRASMSSIWVQREHKAFFNHCFQAGVRRLIPLMTEGYELADLPLFLRDLECCRLSSHDAIGEVIALLGGESIDELKKRLQSYEADIGKLRGTVGQPSSENSRLRAVTTPRAKPGAFIKLPDDFLFGEVRPQHKEAAVVSPPPPLGPLTSFVGSWVGNGFNTIFRPNNSATPTPLPNPLPPGDNILELNLTSESLTFSPNLGSVPNRGTTPQGDIFLNGLPYLQTISDITIHGEKTGIHVEPGLWMAVPKTDDPAEDLTYVRMASIPHGTTIEAQGKAFFTAGPPTIAAIDITPFVAGSNPKNFIKFPSQIATDPKTPRIPQDLTSFIAAGTITQAMLDDPNSVLRDRISKQKIVATNTIVISTNPAAPLFGGGTDNIAFLGGQTADTPKPNARAAQMDAIFWIETVEEVILVPPYPGG
jgi:hypothetical protein